MQASTIYFPALVVEAMMIEPTETETKETLDEFAAVMISIANEDPENKSQDRPAPTLKRWERWTRSMPPKSWSSASRP